MTEHRMSEKYVCTAGTLSGFLEETEFNQEGIRSKISLHNGAGLGKAPLSL